MNNTARVLATALFCGLSTQLCNADSIANLLANSPFVPEGWTPGGAKGGAVSASGQYVFKGVYYLDGSYYVNIAEGGKGRWIRVGDSLDGLKVLGYDETLRKVTISANGKELTLEIPKPAVNSNPVALAVNSNPRAQLTPTAAGDPRAASSRRTLRPMPPPPAWAGSSASNRITQNKFSGSGGGVTTDGGSSPGGESSGGSSGGDSGGSSTPGNPDQGNNNPDPGNETPISTPPPPPNFVPSIPAELQKLIDSGEAPDSR